MANCFNCGHPLEEGATFCGNCGAPANPQGLKNYNPYNYPMYDPTDHTAEFAPEDVSENKVVALAAYLLGLPGVLLAFLAAGNSKYAAFHSRQALRLQLVSFLVVVISLALCWTVIVPILGGICGAVLGVVKIICFFQVCSGKSKEAPIVGSLPFLK